MMRIEQQTICEVCGKRAKSVLKSRNICDRCHRREEKICCPRCNSIVHSVSEVTGLCRRCTIVTARHIGICVHCSRTRSIYNEEERLCHPCHKYFLRRKRPEAQCACCNKRLKVDKETGLCSKCMSQSAKLEGECVYCHRIRAIHDQDTELCLLCYKNLKAQARKRNRSNRLRTCSVCGEFRVSRLSNRAICVPCRQKEINVYAKCAGCKAIKAIHCKAEQLCKRCYEDRCAKKSLDKFLEHFNSPYLYNNQLFALLTTTLHEKVITQKINIQFRVFGQFLQTHQITEPLTWEAIKEMLPPLGPTNRTKPKLVRKSLLALGHLMAAKGMMESYETYILKRNVELKINNAPQHIQHILRLYVSWLHERESRWRHVSGSIEALALFWFWCESYGIKYPHEVTTPVINNYIMTLYWQWSCSSCKTKMTFTPNDRDAPRTCPNCDDVGSISKIDRYTQQSVRAHNNILYVFFEWVRLNHKVLVNPVQRKIRGQDYPIHYYPLEDIRRLCHYISAPDSDPIEALTLYLIIFHALSVWELRHAELPIFHKLDGGFETPPFVSAYYILLPKLEPSRGDRNPGRPDVRVDFPEKAAPWLKPLLERFEHKRQELSKNRSNKYLLLSTHTARHNIPISSWLVREIVQRASQRVLGAKYNPKYLRITVAMMLVDSTNGGILKWLGWSSQQGFKYMWMQREVIQPAE